MHYAKSIVHKLTILCWLLGSTGFIKYRTWMWRIIPLILLQLPKTQIKNIIKMVLKTQNNAVAGHGQGATIAHLLALNPTTSGNHKIWQESNNFQKSQDCHICIFFNHFHISGSVIVFSCPPSPVQQNDPRERKRVVWGKLELSDSFLFFFLERKLPLRLIILNLFNKVGKSNHSWYLLLYFSSSFFSSFTWNW